MNAYSTNLTNMEAMRKEIARLNEIIGKGCLSGKAQVSDKKANNSRVSQFKQGRPLNQAWAWAHYRSQDKWKKDHKWL